MMKRITTFLVLLGAASMVSGCSEEQRNKAKEEFKEEIAEVREDLDLQSETAEKVNFDFVDHGGEPFVVDIEEYTMANDNFRTTIWTGSSLQMTLMSIPVGGDIGAEIHNDVEQFIRIESGKGQVYFGDTEETMQPFATVSDDDVVLVPRGKWHNIKNMGDEPMKLYSLYSPAEHPKGTIHVTMEEGQLADHDH